MQTATCGVIWFCVQAVNSVPVLGCKFSFFCCAMISWYKRSLERQGLGPYYCKQKGGLRPAKIQAKEFKPPMKGLPLPCLTKPCAKLSQPQLNVATTTADASNPRPPSLSSSKRLAIVEGNGFAKQAEDEEWRKWAMQWVASLSPFLATAPAFDSLGDLAIDSLKQVLRSKAGATLRRHLPGWRLWTEFASSHTWPLFAPPLPDLVAFIRALVENGKTVGGAKAVLGALKFVASLMRWDDWLETLSSPIVLAWCNADKSWKARKEAVPLPLHTIAAFERRILDDLQERITQDTLDLVSFLIMVWGALRFSDLQRIDCQSLQIQDGIIRGNCWRTKSSKIGMPFGLLCFGIHNCWQDAALQLQESMRKCDYLFAGPSGARANFCYALGRLRHFLVDIGGISEEQASVYTLHSLKTTALSWALQVDVDAEQRRHWGHHRAKDPGSNMVSKYSRDDVLPALRGQLKVLQCIRQGWVPLTPQARGASAPAPEQQLTSKLEPLDRLPPGLAVFKPVAAEVESDTDSDTSPKSSSSSVSSSSSSSCSEKEQAVVVDNAAHKIATGVYIVNKLTSYFHAAVCLGNGNFGRACAPGKLKQKHWEIWHSEPCDEEEVFLPCAHLACASHL